MAGPYELQSPKDIAMQYGGNKQKIAQAAQMGTIDPTAAVLAGMFIDKMRMAQQEEMAPQKTVAQDVMAAPQMAAGLGATPQAAMAPQMAPTEAGVAALPVPDDMVPDEFAGGGIVAFEAGGKVSLSDVLRTLTMDEARIYQQTGRLPARAQAILTGETPLSAAPIPGMGKAGTGPATISFGGPDVPQTPLPEGMMYFPGIAPLLNGQSANVRPVAPPSPSDIEAIIAQAQRGEGPNVSRNTTINPNIPLPGRAPAQIPTAPAPAAAAQTDPLSGFAEYQAMLRAAGVPADPFAEDREAMKTRQSELAAQRKEDQALAMIAAGLSGMNTRNLAEFASKAGEVGIGMYGQSKKEAREEQREIDKINRDMRKAEIAFKRGDVEKYMDFKDKAEARRIQMMGVEAQRAAAGKPSGQTELIERYAKAKNISFDQALREVGALRAEEKDPFLATLPSRMGGGSNVSAQLADLMKKYPDAFK